MLDGWKWVSRGLRGTTEAETSDSASGSKEVKRHGNSQSIYFVAGGDFEMDDAQKKLRRGEKIFRGNAAVTGLTYDFMFHFDNTRKPEGCSEMEGGLMTWRLSTLTLTRLRWWSGAVKQ